VAESSERPASEDLGSRIRDYFASPQAKQHFFEGFSQASAFVPALNEVSRRNSKPVSESELPEGSAPSEEDEVEIELLCIWCGRVCADMDDLDRHEAECEPD
jgi:hypothetical protein